jgi:hypothetical protein
LHQLGRIQRATRFEGAPQQSWFGHKVNAVDPTVFDRYLAAYQLAPGVTVTVTREDAHLFAQLTGQPKFELFPESERDYFLKVRSSHLSRMLPVA